MPNQTLISVIVPCYKQAQFLPETLQSVLSQTYTNWECIIVDDGSPDNTYEVAQEWCDKDERFKYLKKENGGLPSARNAGIKISHGSYILPLDSDDKIHSAYLENIIKAFSKNPEIELVTSRIQFFGASDDELKLPNYNYKKLLVRNCFVCSSAFKKSSWENAGGYDENMKSFEDWEFWIRILNEKSQVYKIPELMFIYRKHNNGSLSNSFQKNPDFYFGLYDYVYEKHKEIYKKFFPNPIIAYNENLILKEFNQKIKNNFLFKLYSKIKRKV
ncbi:glycosyltransferase [Flavobacterium sp. GA093]|uniref:Glycosyltransferase n=1 Tax=Flavobacterium hydrocarbonoxydans TaxID=2683249 RepID=A0A6I4NTS2_9FLAO|nr:glycosyltransferase [Flavobacterium hydrocarbonoxydans]MWB94507.1 glycosyltransferase [Flavobacterium hydrocarbonoxydans]